MNGSWKSINYNKFIIIIIMSLLMWAIISLLFFFTDVDPRLMQKTIKLNVKNKLCHVNYIDNRSYISNNEDMKMIYYVTPTYPRPEQIPELTRLAHTLMHVPRIHWIVADDQPVCSDLVLDLLRRTDLPFTHISSPKPFHYTSSRFPRGVANRRAAITWLNENVEDGVMYFGDDDNTIDLRLFDEIRTTKKLSMFPVGLIGTYGVSSPVVSDGKVVGFFDSWPGLRTFPVDMAGFAVNMKYLNAQSVMPYTEGREEDMFLVSLGFKLDDIEPLAQNCTKIMVWHTKTMKNKKPSVKLDVEKLKNASKYENLAHLMGEVSKMGMAQVNPKEGTKAVISRDGKTYESLSDMK